MTMIPDVSHFYGREVTSIEPTEEGGWAIHLTGGMQVVKIGVEEYPMPDEILVGMALQRAVIDADSTVLYFGTDRNPNSSRVQFSSNGYALIDPDFEGGRRVFPGSENNEPVPEYPPSAEGERVVDAPSDDAQGSEIDAEAIEEDEEGSKQ